MSMKRIAKLAVGVVAIVLVIVALFKPSASEAVNRPTDGEVFSGRFIPAFLGAAYDPEQAFLELSGLPVYVFAFDFWDQSTGSGSWIISNLAVRTQVRADGSFQAQGLPTASHYGVYFPFKLSATGVERVDCIPGPDVFDANPLNPCKTEVQNDERLFRMPESGDQIIDVFSYKANFLATPIQVDSQVDSGGGFEQVNVHHAFITNRKDVDIENNINTFPLVPRTTLRTEIETVQDPGVELEVWAQRIATERFVTGPSGTFILDAGYPTIRGKAIQTSNQAGLDYYTFQSFAPPGYYVAIVWRKEKNSPSYQDWNGKDSLNTEVHGIGQIHVSGGTASDWRNALSFAGSAEPIRPFRNTITVWGTVKEENGQLLTSLTQLAGVGYPDAYLHVLSDMGRQYVSTPATDPRLRFYNTCCKAVGTATADNFLAPRGIYMVDLDPTASLTEAQPIGDNISIFLDTDNSGLSDLEVYSRATITTGLIHSYEGPRRHDITLDVSEQGNTNPGGYDEGIYIKVQEKSLEPAAGGTVQISVIGPRNPDNSLPPYNIAAEGRTYQLDRLGEAVIPPGDLAPAIEGIDYTDLIYFITFRGPYQINFATVANSSNGDSETFTFDSNGLAVVKMVLQAAVANKENIHNSPIFNALGTLRLNNKAYAQPPTDYVVIPVNILPPTNNSASGVITMQITLNAVRNAFWRFEDAIAECQECFITEKPAGTSADAITDVTGLSTVYAHLPPPSEFGTVRELCLRHANSTLESAQCYSETLFGNETLGPMTYSVSAISQVGNEVFAPSADITVDDVTAAPASVTLNFALDCQEIGNAYSVGLKTPFNLDFGNQIQGTIAKFGCDAGLFFMNAVPSILSLVYRYGLQTRALTQDQAVGLMFDVVRNLSNFFYVFMFIMIAVMTIVRYQPEQWHIRVLLPQLVVALVFSNFALLIAQAILDLNNFATFALFNFTSDVIQEYTTSPGGFFSRGVLPGAGLAIAGGVQVMGALSASIMSVATGLLAVIGPASVVALPIWAVFAIAILAVLVIQVILLLAVFFARYAMIWLFVIAAPLVFTLSVLPWSRGFLGKWLQGMFAIAGIQTAVAALLSVGTLLLTVGVSENSLFGGFGVAIIAFIIFYFAILFPFRMMRKYTGGIGIPLGLGTLAVAKKIQDYGKGRLESKMALEERLDQRFKQDAFQQGLDSSDPKVKDRFNRRFTTQAARVQNALFGENRGIEALEDVYQKQQADIKKAQTEGTKTARRNYYREFTGNLRRRGLNVNSSTPTNLNIMQKGGFHAKFLKDANDNDVTFSDVGLDPAALGFDSSLNAGSKMRVAAFTNDKGVVGGEALSEEEMLKQFEKMADNVKANVESDAAIPATDKQSVVNERLSQLESLISKEVTGYLSRGSE